MSEGSEHLSDAATTEGLPVAPSLGPALDAVSAPRQPALVSPRVLVISGIAVVIGLAAGGAAQVLTRLIVLITNLGFYGRLSLAPASPADNHLGALVVVVPVIGAVLVGLMARYGSQAIRGHGIPEAMEQVLFNQSRIPPRLTWLKPLSAAISIGTGGPFGAEGPIIATGGALGSVVGQFLTITADERKTLLAAGAAAGMAATFGARSRRCCWRSSCCCSSTAALGHPGRARQRGGHGLRMAIDGSAPCSRCPSWRSRAAAALASTC
jgi:hypothetical protein